MQIEGSFEQILDLVKKLPTAQKIKLTKELEKEGIASKLSQILDNFKTNELSLETIDSEAEIVRKKIYESQKTLG